MSEMESSSKVVRPYTAPYTGLPESAAARIEGLMVKPLSTPILRNMGVAPVTGEGVDRIYSGLEKPSFGGDSEELLKSVLKSVRADTIIACKYVGRTGPAFLNIQCRATLGELVCRDASDDVGSCDDVEIKDVRSLGSEKAKFPWDSPSEYRDHVFSDPAWKLATASPPDIPREVAAEAAHRKRSSVDLSRRA